jgi:hypothetical protein
MDMKRLAYEIHCLCRRNPHGSFATRIDRERILLLAAAQLEEAGYRNLHAAGLKRKHIEALLDRWRSDDLSTGTIKNRLAALRWWCERIGKRNLIPRDNQGLGVSKRVHVTNLDKSKQLSEPDLAAVRCPFVAASLLLQQTFGLRREESLKIRPVLADKTDMLYLYPSWTKGGRAREIPIRTPEQRAAVESAKELAGSGSMIPERLSYRNQLNVYKSECQRIGLGGGHGLRHAYAQTRYEQLTGRPCSAKGGSRRRGLSPADRLTDDAARLQISSELGHARIDVVAVYVGS